MINVGDDDAFVGCCCSVAGDGIIDERFRPCLCGGLLTPNRRLRNCCVLLSTKTELSNKTGRSSLLLLSLMLVPLLLLLLLLLVVVMLLLLLLLPLLTDDF